MEFSHKIQPREATEQSGLAKVIQLPLWPEAKRGAPNTVLRVGAVLCEAQGSARLAQPPSLLLGREAQADRLTGEKGRRAILWTQEI
jgi:hypothetical protein